MILSEQENSTDITKEKHVCFQYPRYRYRYSAAQHSTKQHIKTQHSAAQHSTAQHSTGCSAQQSTA